MRQHDTPDASTGVEGTRRQSLSRTGRARGGSCKRGRRRFERSAVPGARATLALDASGQMRGMRRRRLR
jgi:hypothetical protein